MRTVAWRTSRRALLVSAVIATSAITVTGSSTPGLATLPAQSASRPATALAASVERAHGVSGRTLHFDVRFSPFTLIDVDGSGPHDFSDGDEIVFHDRLVAHGHQVGDEGGSCVVVDGAAALANCTGVIRLPHGLISYQFLNEPPPDKTLVVTGGTGRFLDVGGSGLLHEDATAPTGTLTVRLVLADSD